MANLMQDSSVEVVSIDDTEESISIPDGSLLDIVSGTRHLKDTPKEQVRQRIARALFHEHNISYEDMELDFPITVNKKRHRIDIGIFHHAQEHTEKNLSRIVVCRPEPNVGKKTVRIRDYEQADKDLQELKDVMVEIASCKYGLWTNGLEFFYLEKREDRFQTDFDPIGNWPPSGESVGTREIASIARTQRADADMLRITFRRCHDFIHGNEGMPKDAAFWQFLYLIYCKLHDERTPGTRRFWAGPKEQFDPEGRKKIRSRIEPLFAEVKREYPTIFRDNDEITLSDRALAFMVSELSRYDLSRAEVDAKGAAYQEVVGDNLRGDRGQYFTPRGAIKLMVEILDPKEYEKLLDLACGTGGFFAGTLEYMVKKFEDEANLDIDTASTEEFMSLQERLRRYVETQIFGADFDPFLVRAAQMQVMMAGSGRGHIYHINSLEFPRGHLPDLEQAKRTIRQGTIDILMTNPPFGSEIPVTDPQILEHYELAHDWERAEDGSYRRTGKRKSSVAPEILFIEQCINWLKPKGRMGIVLPDGVLGNPAAEYIRAWILRHTWVLASVDLPVEVFIVEANVNILTSLLFLKKKSQEEMLAEDLAQKSGKPIDYPVFMAVAEKVGYDRRGKPLYKRTPAGEDIVTIETKIEKIRINGRVVERPLRRPVKERDNDLEVIGRKYREFRQRYPEPGL